MFAAETNDLIKNASAKLKAKNADMIVANDVLKEGAGFEQGYQYNYGHRFAGRDGISFDEQGAGRRRNSGQAEAIRQMNFGRAGEMLTSCLIYTEAVK